MRLAVPKATIDLTGPTDCTIGTDEDRDRIVRRLGPDPLRHDADPQQAFDAIVRRAAPIGQLLLDQKVMSGVGNVYRAEALFVNGINPKRPGNEISVPEFEGLWATIVAMLRQGVADNRIITLDRDEFDVPAGPTQRGETTYVYHRDLCLRCGKPDPDRRSRRTPVLLLPGLPTPVIVSADLLGMPGGRIVVATPVPQAQLGLGGRRTDSPARHEGASALQPPVVARRSPRRQLSSRSERPYPAAKAS